MGTGRAEGSPALCCCMWVGGVGYSGGALPQPAPSAHGSSAASQPGLVMPVLWTRHSPHALQVCHLCRPPDSSCSPARLAPGWLACFPWRPASRPPLPPRAMCLDIRSWWPGPSLQPGSWLPARWASRSLGGTDQQASLLSRRLQLLPTNPALGRGCPSESVRPWALSLGPTAPHGALLYVMINLLSKSNNSLS